MKKIGTLPIENFEFQVVLWEHVFSDNLVIYRENIRKKRTVFKNSFLGSFFYAKKDGNIVEAKK